MLKGIDVNAEVNLSTIKDDEENNQSEDDDDEVENKSKINNNTNNNKNNDISDDDSIDELERRVNNFGNNNNESADESDAASSNGDADSELDSMKMVEIGKDKHESVLETKFDAEDHEIEETHTNRDNSSQKNKKFDPDLKDDDAGLQLMNDTKKMKQ